MFMIAPSPIAYRRVTPGYVAGFSPKEMNRRLRYNRMPGEPTEKLFQRE
jgi:hypothetical protein